MSLAARYHPYPAAAWVKGTLPAEAGGPPLGELGEAELEALLARGQAAGLDLQAFKRSRELPRVRRALGLLRGLAPSTLLDVGSGRGVFLWPLLEAMPGLPVVAVDSRISGLDRIEAVARGGLPNLRPVRMDALALALGPGAVDVVTALEVLEHVVEPWTVARELLRVARRAVLFSVPSGPDDNPEHLRLFTKKGLLTLFLEAGARRVQIEHVLGHRIGLAALER